MRLPVELTEAPRWVVWREVLRSGDDKPQKMPYNARTGEPASSTDSETWSTYTDALACYESDPEHWNGIGFVLGDGYAGVDLDDCIIDGVLHPDARRIVDLLGSYAEVSPSGGGVKIIMRGTKPGTRCKSRQTVWGGAVELYDGSRFFTVTGDRVEGAPVVVSDASDALAAIYHEHFPKREPSPPVAYTNGHTRAGADDRVEWCRNYISKMPDAVSGEGGHDRTFHYATTCWRFDLSEDEAWEVMQWANASKCHPAWDERDLRHKLESARRVVEDAGEVGVMLRERGGPTEPMPRVIDGGPRDDSDSIQAPRDRAARIQSAIFNPRPITTLVAPPEPDWLWEGYWGPGVVTLLSGHPKAGKSTLIHYLLHDLQHGGGLVDGPSDVRVCVLSEEPDGLWVERRERHGLDDRLLIHPLRTMGRPTRDQWHRLIGEICGAVERAEVGAVVVDTLAAAWPVVEENDAAGVVDAMSPLRVLADAGCSVLLIHHTRKSGGDEGLSARGSSALAGAVDIVMDLRRHNPQSSTDPVRVIRAWSRYASTDPELCVRLTPDGYEVIGDVRAVDEAELVERLAGILPDDALKAMTAEEARTALGEGAPGVKKIRGVLVSHAERMDWKIDKASNRKGGWRFWK